MKINLKKILLKCKSKDVGYILTHDGFIDNCDLNREELSHLRELASELQDRDLIITFDGIAISPYVTSYNGGQVLAGIKFNNLEIWN